MIRSHFLDHFTSISVTDCIFVQIHSFQTPTAQKLARCRKVAARGRGHEYLWLRKEDILQHLLHREGEAGIHSEDVGHSSGNETGFRSHRRARTYSAGVPRGFSLCSGLHRQLLSFRGSILNESKDEVNAKLQRFIIDVGTHSTLVSDGALEFKSKQFSDLCTSNGIKQEFSAPYTPDENGKAERA